MSRIFFALYLIIYLFSCHNHHTLDNKKIVKIIRLDSMLFEIKEPNEINKIKNVHKKHTAFLEVYLKNAIGINLIGKDSAQYYKSILAFIKNKDISALYNDTKSKFTNLEQYEIEIGNALFTLNKHFSEIKQPTIYSFISALNIAAFTYESHLGIGLDLFMGKDYNIYKKSRHPQYLIDDFEPNNISIWAIKTFLNEKIPFNPSTTPSLLDHLIHKGETINLMSKLMPHRKIQELLSYSDEEYQWCISNEREIWLYFVERNLLYEKDQKVYMKYINNGPYTSGMPNESPGDIGGWVGLMLIKSYYKNNPNTSLFTATENEANSSFLEKAKYKP